MLYRSGSVSCWGENENGQLGDGEFGSNVYSTVPVGVQGITDAVAIGAGWEHTCAVHATGEVSCWGDDSHGELGNGEESDFQPLPVKVVGITDAVAVTAGHWHTCALRESGSIACWGADHDGQLGDGQTGDEGNMSAVPVDVTGVSDAVAVSAGGEHTCAVHATGEVSCWGDNWQGELGTGEAGNEFDSVVPLKVSAIDDAVDISSGDWHTCAVHEGGKVSCWGDNASGQLGSALDWQSEFSAVPKNVTNMSDAVSVAAGSSHTCALREGDSVSCWGSNASGQLGTSPADSFFSTAPIMLEGIDDAMTLTAGAGHNCVIRQSGGVFCWGANSHGQLGHGQDGGVSYEKVRVAGIDDATKVAAASRYTCITHATGEVSCWGSNWRGEGPGTPDGTYSILPVKVDGIETAVEISGDVGVACAATEEREASCWGFYFGSEPVATDDGDATPVLVKWGDTSNITRIETGGSHACALHSDGTITCGGANWYGNLGNGEFGTSIDWIPKKVVGIDDAVDVSLGFSHSCAVHATGEASCWGRNDQGQLGNGTDGLANNSPTPVKVQGITDAVGIALGSLSTSCVLHETGEVSCWGPNAFGELGTAEEAGGLHSSIDHVSVPVKIEGITDATAVTAGNNHICVLHETSEVSCWGTNTFGELGTGDHISDDRTATPQKVTGITGVADIDAGRLHTCVVTNDGSVTCWGWDDGGQLGDGQATLNTDSFTPVAVFGTVTPPASDSPVDIAAGVRHTCMLYEKGEIWCWGDNENGQLGDGEFGSNVYSTIPVKVQDINDAVAIGAGWEHTCAVHATGEVSCWGDDTYGELGNGETMSSSPLPVKVVDIDDAVTVTAGHWHTCALRENGSIACWGNDSDGQLGDGQTGDEGNMSSVPVEVTGISDAAAVSAGGEHTCALHENGEVSCWGDNWRGELGTGEAGNEFDSPVPVKAAGIDDAVGVSSGDWHTCALRESGSVSCWGGNWTGELGTGVVLENFISADPVTVENLSDAAAISAGSGYTCAVHESGSVSCWGDNNLGQLGNPSVLGFSPEPVAVQGINDVIALTTGAGGGHSCAIQESGETSCWGANFHGQLGNSQDSGISNEKVQVEGIDDAIDVSAATRHSCATHASGEVSCWGQNWRGRLDSDLLGSASPRPVRIEGITTASGISTNTGLSCAVLESGEASCWGFYWFNELVDLGNGNVSTTPALWQGADDITRIFSGGHHICALHSNRTISCAGANWYGNLGNGEIGTEISYVPAKVVGIDDAIDIALGFAHSCAVHATGEVSCWGRNDDGQLGNGKDGLENNSPIPVKVQDITDAIGVFSHSTSFTCALHATGEVSCWGQNLQGQLGASTDIGGEFSSVDHSSVPVKIEGVTGAVDVTTGNRHACVLHESGEISCWGSNFAGELGSEQAVANDFSRTPVKVDGVTDAKAVSAGAFHTCALLSNGEITCWGWNESGQLGNGEAFVQTNSAVPVKVFGT